MLSVASKQFSVRFRGCLATLSRHAGRDGGGTLPIVKGATQGRTASTPFHAVMTSEKGTPTLSTRGECGREAVLTEEVRQQCSGFTGKFPVSLTNAQRSCGDPRVLWGRNPAFPGFLLSCHNSTPGDLLAGLCSPRRPIETLPVDQNHESKHNKYKRAGGQQKGRGHARTRCMCHRRGGGGGGAPQKPTPTTALNAPNTTRDTAGVGPR